MQKKNKQTMNRIFDSAELLFSQKDFYDVKMDEIAKNANVGKGTIYTYFKSKEELLFKCIIHNVEADQETIRTTINTDEPFNDRLRSLYYNMYGFFERKGPLIHQYMKISPKYKVSKVDHEFLIEKFRSGLEIMTEFFKEGMDLGILIDFLSPKQMAIVFQKMFDFNVIFSFYGEPEMNVEDGFKIFRKTFFRMGVINE